MVQCPRCHNSVNETIHAACPTCATPLTPTGNVNSAPPASAQPALTSAPGAYRPNARVSLTGEVMEDAAPPAAAYGNAPGGLPPLPSGRPIAPPSARPTPSTGYRRQEVAPDNSRRNALIINLSVVLLLALASGGGGWWYWKHRTNPKAQVQRYFHAIQWLDWGVVYDLSASPPGDKTRPEFVAMMNDKFDNNPVLKIVARKGMETIKCDAGEPTITGDEATVPVTVGEAGKPLELHLKNFGGVWKIEPLAENPITLLHGGDKEDAAPPASMPTMPGGLPAQP